MTDTTVTALPTINDLAVEYANAPAHQLLAADTDAALKVRRNAGRAARSIIDGPHDREPDETMIGDLLANLIHLCTVTGIRWQTVLDRAQGDAAHEHGLAHDTCVWCKAPLGSATGVCSGCGADPFGYYDD